MKPDIAESVAQYRKVCRLVADAISQAEADGESWPGYVDLALERAGIRLADEQPDGSDRWQIVRLAEPIEGFGSLVVYREGRAGADAYDVIS